MSLIDYGLYFGLTLLLSTLFATGGVGSAVALVPMLSSLGVAFALARALGLFVHTISTAAASISATILQYGMNEKQVKRLIALLLLLIAAKMLWEAVASGLTTLVDPQPCTGSPLCYQAAG